VYKQRGKKLENILAETGADTIVAVMQGAGTRLYTFVWTMYDVFFAAGA
jgi:hypothetical protein